MLADVQEFIDGDDAYLRWLDQHSHSFILSCSQ